MSADTPIEWTVTIGPDGARHKGMTFNPWWGCAKVSPACKHCYAERLAARFNRGAWTPNGERAAASEATWLEPLKWDRKAAKLGVRLKVFCASMADVFEDRADLDPLRERLWALIAATPHLDWLLLTKRPDVMARWATTHPWPVNAWAGCTVESQEWADRRIPWLLKVPAQVLFLSVEPMLGAVDLYVCTNRSGVELDSEGAPHFNPVKGFTFFNSGDPGVRIPRLSWIIGGGESGPGARPSHPDWFRSLRDQCAAAGVPFHFKQWGEFAPVGDGFGTNVRRVGKHAAGRLLDGIEHNDYPKVNP